MAVINLKIKKRPESTTGHTSRAMSLVGNGSPIGDETLIREVYVEGSDFTDLDTGDFYVKKEDNSWVKTGSSGGGSTSGDVLTLKGNWDANTNTPELLDANGAEGDLYIVSVAGSTPLTTSTGVYSDWQVGQEVYKTVDGNWELIPDTRNVYDSGTDTVTKADLRVGGDVYASGEFFAQQNSTIYANNIKVGVTGDKLVITDQATNKQALIAKNEVDSGSSTGTKDIFRYSPFDLNTIPEGQPNPDDSLTFNSTPFVEELTGENKYYFQVTLQSTSTLVTDTWYLRSFTGVTNAYLYVYKGAVNFGVISQKDKYWTTNTDKDIENKTNLVTDVGGAGNDITFPLGNTFFETVGDVYTYVVVADNNFTAQGQTYTGVDVPYIKGDGAKWGVVNTSSKLIINGNLSPNEFNNILQFNNNNTEYYGCDMLLEAGVYDKFEIPYKNRNSTSDPAYLYAIILDQDNNTLAYQRLYVDQNAATEGTFIINFATDVLIEEAGLFQVVIGRRKWDGITRRVEIFGKDVNSSDGSVWIAYSNQNAVLNQDDTSGVDWSTINKQNYNRIPKALIYKF